MEAKPNLNSTVPADLPEEVCIDSTGRPSSRKFSTSIKSTKHKGDKSDVIDILRDTQADFQQVLHIGTLKVMKMTLKCF